MNPLAHWNQWRLNQLNEMHDLQHELRDLVRRSRARRSQDPPRVRWIPLVDVSEDDRGYVIKADLPQVNKEDVRITLQEGSLIIRGERRFDQNTKKGQPTTLACGCFAHTFVIPNDARPARMTTVFKNGVLLVHLTRNEKGTIQQLKPKPCCAGSLGVGNGQ